MAEEKKRPGEKEIRITSSVPGHAHTKLRGICGVNVTEEDIRREIFHPIFGGRDVFVLEGQWSAIRHED